MEQIRIGDIDTVLISKRCFFEVNNEKALLQSCRRTTYGKLARLHLVHKNIEISKPALIQSTSGGITA